LPITSQTAFLTEIRDLDSESIPLGRLGFFREQTKHLLHELVRRKYQAVRDARPDFTQRDLARRIHRKPEQVSRWLGAPGNLTIDTMSDLLIGMGAVLNATVVNVDSLIDESRPPTYSPPEGQRGAGVPKLVQRSEPPQPRRALL